MCLSSAFAYLFKHIVKHFAYFSSKQQMKHEVTYMDVISLSYLYTELIYKGGDSHKGLALRVVL